MSVIFSSLSVFKTSVSLYAVQINKYAITFVEGLYINLAHRRNGKENNKD